MRLRHGNCVRPVPVARFSRNVRRSDHARHAVLLECSALDHARRAVLLECSALDHACRAVLLECPAFDYACLAVLSRCPVFDHACCLPHSAKQDGLRYLAFLFRRGRAAGLCVLKRLCGHPTWRVHFWFVRFLTAARGTRGTEPAAWCKCAFSQSHWLCNVFRGESVGAARPKPAPKSLRLSGLSSLGSR